MDNTEEIINQFAEELLREYKAAVPVASGKTRDSLRIETRPTGFTMYGGAQISALINGRKPTSSGASSSGETLQQAILGWIKAKSISPRDGISQVSLSWAISKSIHRDGIKPKGNFFEGILTKSRIDSLTKTILTDVQPVLLSDIIKDVQFK
jgi:hypothetical protein